jgi:hypothetical protein
MRKTIITVRGFRNRGKSKTIALAYDELRDMGDRIEGYRGEKEVRGAILVIDGVKVGIISVGDVAGHLENWLKHLIARGCVVIVCAARALRTPGESVTFQTVERCVAGEEPPYQLVVIEKHADADHNAGNRQKAEEVVAAVRQAIAAAQRGDAA